MWEHGLYLFKDALDVRNGCAWVAEAYFDRRFKYKILGVQTCSEPLGLSSIVVPYFVAVLQCTLVRAKAPPF